MAAVKNLNFEGGQVIVEALKAYTDAIIAAIPADKYIDQTKTTLVDNFAFNTATYPGATDPSLDGKPVMVLAVRDSAGSTTTYSFLNMERLLNVYTAADNSMTINGYTLAAKVSPDTDNALSVENNGLKVTVATTEEVQAMCDTVLGTTAGA